MLSEILLITQSAGSQEASNPLWYLGVATLLSLVPLAIGLCTSFVKISVVLGLLKSALGTQHAPSGLVTMALSLAITGYTMFPVLQESAAKLPEGTVSHLANQDLQKLFALLTPATEPWIAFLQKHSGKREIAVLEQAGSQPINEKVEGAPTSLAVLLPSFLLTELKEAFAMGFVILLPCLVIDLIVANILMGLGMMMVTPTLITLPLKLLLFVISDAWLLITQGLINSYAG